MSDQVPLDAQNRFPAATSSNTYPPLGTTMQSLFFQDSDMEQDSEQQYPDNAQGENPHSTDGNDSNSNSTSTPANYYPPRSFVPPENAHVNDKLMQMHNDSQRAPATVEQFIQNDENAAARAEVDSRSIYIGNVDYGATPLEIQQHFSESGTVERVTIMTNKATGHPKGFAYLEFSLPDGANKAVATQDGSIFRDRELKVNLKRTNVPGLSATNRGSMRGRGRGRGMMRGRGRPGFRGRGGFRGGPRFLPY